MLISLRTSFGAPPAVSECTWPQLCSWLKEQADQVYATKDAVPLVAFGRFTGGWKRENLDPAGLYVLALDFDHVAMGAVSDLVACARAFAPCDKLLIYTTYSHGCKNDEARLRVLYPSEQPMPPAHYVQAWSEASHEFGSAGHEVDPQTSNPERCWYVPAVNPNAPDWAQQPWVQEFERL